jgi:nucleotide-binding universal stress UspA family protein
MTAIKWRPNKILVATDFSASAEATLSQALWLAESTGAAVTIAHALADIRQAVCETPDDARWQLVAGDIEAFQRQLRRKSDERLADLVQRHRRRGVELHYETLLGVPFVELIHAVQKEGHDLVMAGTRGLSGVKRFLLGSTAEKLVCNCPCPTWIVRGGREGPVKTILVPVDFSPVSVKMLEVATSLATLASGRLVVMHTLENPLGAIVESLKMAKEETDKEIEEVAGDSPSQQRRRLARRAARERLSALARDHVDPAVPAECRLAEGEAWRAIAAAARRHAVDLIVMGSVGRTGVPGFLIGNTAEKVVRTCDCSIVVVKPDGFVSPVQPPFWSLHPEE